MSDTMAPDVDAPPEPNPNTSAGAVPSAVAVVVEPNAATAGKVLRMQTAKLNFWYGPKQALYDISLAIPEKSVTAFIGPSGCGKSTYLRCLNRMNDIIPDTRVEGEVLLDGRDIYGAGTDIVDLRRQVGMVFQKSNPFPKSIFDNVAYGLRLNRMVSSRGELHDRVEASLRSSALWDEVKDRLRHSALGMSGGQQQRLCIARTIAVEPDVVLMDEPCSALDPIATARIEELMRQLKDRFTIVIVTHNMQQAARVSDRTAFFTADVVREGDQRTGVLIEYDNTQKIFSNPGDERTENYVTGRFG